MVRVRQTHLSLSPATRSRCYINFLLVWGNLESLFYAISHFQAIQWTGWQITSFTGNHQSPIPPRWDVCLIQNVSPGQLALFSFWIRKSDLFTSPLHLEYKQVRDILRYGAPERQGKEDKGYTGVDGGLAGKWSPLVRTHPFPLCQAQIIRLPYLRTPQHTLTMRWRVRRTHRRLHSLGKAETKEDACSLLQIWLIWGWKRCRAVWALFSHPTHSTDHARQFQTSAEYNWLSEMPENQFIFQSTLTSLPAI